MAQRRQMAFSQPGSPSARRRPRRRARSNGAVAYFRQRRSCLIMLCAKLRPANPNCPTQAPASEAAHQAH
eukprot:15458341-Alexandrium_andersonii.AAC.1